MNNPALTIKVLFFASLRDIVGQKTVLVECGENESVAQLRTRLVQLYPGLKNALDHAICSVNREYAGDSTLLSNNDEVGFFPPVSGGGHDTVDIVSLQEENLDANLVLQSITTPETGAACIFTGFVRGITAKDNHRQTQKLEYEAYTLMAEEKMLQICAEIRAKWPLVKIIYIVQRIGTLLPGEVTIAIGCSSAHRDEGIFEAARYGIDRMKEIVPVWKKEYHPEGEEWVHGYHHPDKDNA